MFAASSEPHWLVPVLFAVQVLGLAAAWLARASQGSSHHGLFQALFLILLATVSVAAIAATRFASGDWLLPATTLAVMIVGTTCDFRRPHRAASGF